MVWVEGLPVVLMTLSGKTMVFIELFLSFFLEIREPRRLLLSLSLYTPLSLFLLLLLSLLQKTRGFANDMF